MKALSPDRSASSWPVSRQSGIVAVAIVTLLLVLPAGADAGLRPAKVQTPPYKGSVGVATYSTFAGECASGNVTASPTWTPATGGISIAVAGAAKSCPRSFGSSSTDSRGQADSKILVFVPFRVATHGNHSVTSSWTFTLSTARTKAVGGCPAKQVSFPLPLNYSYFGQCDDGSFTYFFFQAILVDLNNTSWHGYNLSGANIVKISEWVNETSCGNNGTYSGCGNYTGDVGSKYWWEGDAAGFLPFKWTGTMKVTAWTNGTGMKTADHYALVGSVEAFVEAFVHEDGLKARWAASASASINLATLGNGAKLNSITIS